MCVTSGAQKSVIRKSQAKAFCDPSWIKIKLKHVKTPYKFGDRISPSIAQIPICITTPDGAFISLSVVVINVNIPFIIDLKASNRFGLFAGNAENILVSKIHGWTMPITRKHGHLYIIWFFPEICSQRLN